MRHGMVADSKPLHGVAQRILIAQPILAALPPQTKSGIAISRMLRQIITRRPPPAAPAWPAKSGA